MTCSTARWCGSSCGPPTAGSSTPTRAASSAATSTSAPRARRDRRPAASRPRSATSRSPRTVRADAGQQAARGVPAGPHAVRRAAAVRGVLRVRLGAPPTAAAVAQLRPDRPRRARDARSSCRSRSPGRWPAGCGCACASGRRLLQRALDASDVERRQIASDLHDGVVQDLAGVAYGLSAASPPADATGRRRLLERVGRHGPRAACAPCARCSSTSTRPTSARGRWPRRSRDLARRRRERGVQTHLDVAGRRRAGARRRGRPALPGRPGGAAQRPRPRRRHRASSPGGRRTAPRVLEVRDDGAASTPTSWPPRGGGPRGPRGAAGARHRRRRALDVRSRAGGGHDVAGRGAAADDIRVVVADDHAVVRGGLEQLLATADDIELVGRPPTARRRSRLRGATRPDVVLMDLSMPVLDGVEATRRIVAADPGARVVVLTSFADDRRSSERARRRRRSATCSSTPSPTSCSAPSGPRRPAMRRSTPRRRGCCSRRGAGRARRRAQPAEEEVLRLVAAGPGQQADRPPPRDHRAHREGAPHQRVRRSG